MKNYFNNLVTLKRKILLSGMIGNLLESFDVMICAYLAPFISKAFFPPSSQSTSLLNIFSIFLIGYIARPFGSLLIGTYSDQAGRKKILVYSILFTGLFTALIGLIPTYGSIGLTATCSFIALRVMQNMFVGGEYISSISYLIESADNGKRGYYGSWVSVGLNGGTLLASLSVYYAISWINNKTIPDWGWRLVFFVSIIGTMLGLWIRSSLPESLGFILSNSNQSKTKRLEILGGSINLIKSHSKKCLALIAITFFGVSETASIYIYSPIHMYTVNSISPQDALEINTLSLSLLLILIPLFGNLYDYFNKIRILFFATLLFMLLSPIYYYYLSYGSYLNILLIKLIFSIPSACYYPLATVLITESFPIKIRCTSLALIYQTAAALAGGLTPILLIWLMNAKSIKPYQGLPQASIIIITGILAIIGLHYLKNHSKASLLAIKNTQTKNIKNLSLESA